MRMKVILVLSLLCAVCAYASVFGSMRGLVHDPQHRPIAGAQVTVHAAHSDWQRSVTSDSDGQFLVAGIPAGEYTVEVQAPGFATQTQRVTVLSDSTRELHFPMSIEATSSSIEVSAAAEGPQSTVAAATTMVPREEISRAPGALNANSLAMVTDYVPGAVITHNLLHIRGGHQYSWLIDGIPVPNTNIASNVGPQFDPKDIDYLEVSRGGLNAEHGDRAYGVLNVVTRSGFERSREGELVASYGSFHQTDDQINLGSHTERFAWYTSLSGNRSDLGLETPVPEALHDIGSGLSGFASFIFNRTPQDQLRSVVSVRGDHYQVPNTPDQQADGVRDVEHERDVFATASWTRTTPSGLIFTVAPFYHFNASHYEGRGGTSVVPDDDRGSHYAGGVMTLGVTHGHHSARAGMQSFLAHDDRTLALSGDASMPFRHAQTMRGSVSSIFGEEQYRPASWLELTAGVRYTHFSGGVVENAVDPRLAAAVTIPRLAWTVHGSYSRYYQAPPLFSISGPVEALAAQQGFGFLPLRGERDEQHEVGISIPAFGWRADFSEFRTTARNYFDHDALGNSNIFFPLTIARARIHGWEATVGSRQFAHRARVHLAFSRQWVQGRGGITGGLTDFTAPDPGYYYLDHDQRDSLSTGADINLPRRTWAAFNVSYGSGFLNGDGPAHLPPHTTADISLGHSFGERWMAQVSALNVGDARYLLDNSNTLGGTHYARSREVLVRVTYRFQF